MNYIFELIEGKNIDPLDSIVNQAFKFSVIYQNDATGAESIETGNK